jgi:hypothetical protein
MAQTHKASGQAVEKHATANGSEVSREETEELTALRAIVEQARLHLGQQLRESEERLRDLIACGHWVPSVVSRISRPPLRALVGTQVRQGPS